MSKIMALQQCLLGFKPNTLEINIFACAPRIL